MTRLSPKFSKLTLEHRKNVIIYVLTVFVTLVALGTQLASAPAFGGDYQLFQLRAGRAAGILVSGLCKRTSPDVPEYPHCSFIWPRRPLRTKLPLVHEMAFVGYA